MCPCILSEKKLAAAGLAGGIALFGAGAGVALNNESVRDTVRTEIAEFFGGALFEQERAYND